MTTRSLATAVASRKSRTLKRGEIQSLHDRCGFYTKPEIVSRILDAVKWRAQDDLSTARLLEPAAGNGAFVVEAAKRLVGSLRRQQVALTATSLKNKIWSCEIHPGEVKRARRRVYEALRELGVHHGTARSCVNAWVSGSDFLLADNRAEQFTHVVGNPPYVRWSKVPAGLRARYERKIVPELTGGDLFLPFLDKALEWLAPGGRCGFICSDRWRYMAFAEHFRKKWLPLLRIDSEDSISSKDAFQNHVSSYPTVLVASKRAAQRSSRRAMNTPAGRTLEDMGCVVRVGPALGHTAAFVLQSDENDVEEELLRPWIGPSEISEGSINSDGRRVVTMYDDGGKLRNLRGFPLLRARLERFRAKLEKRSIVQNGAPWYKTIDRVRAIDWFRPKLLVPELARVPRLAIDESGAIPSHGVYAIFVPGDDVETLYELLKDRKLAQALDSIAPRVNGDYVRCYKRFLLKVRLRNADPAIFGAC